MALLLFYFFLEAGLFMLSLTHDAIPNFLFSFFVPRVIWYWGGIVTHTLCIPCPKLGRIRLLRILNESAAGSAPNHKVRHRLARKNQRKNKRDGYYKKEKKKAMHCSEGALASSNIIPRV